jgi:hypothetical protein
MDGVCSGGDGLVEVADIVTELAGERVIRDDAETDFVADQDDRAVCGGDGGNEGGLSGGGIGAGEQEIAGPEGEAIDKKNRAGGRIRG